MTHRSLRALFAAFLFSLAAYFFPPGVLTAAKPPQAAAAPAVDRTQWRKLQRRMHRDEVKNLLGDPVTVSVSRFSEVWYYPRGSVIFDGKGRLDTWTEY